MNELQNSGLFGCSKKMVKNELTSFGRNVTIRRSKQFDLLCNSLRVLIIDKKCCNDLVIDLKICNYEYLESIVVNKNSLKNLKSLVISNNPQLKSIETKNSYSEFGTGAFNNVKIVEISSIF